MNAVLSSIILETPPPAEPPAPPSTGDSGAGGEGDAVNLREAIQRAQKAAGITPLALGERADTWGPVFVNLTDAEKRAWFSLDMPDSLLRLAVVDLVQVARHFGRNL